jgi:hypothetical protein
MFVPPDENGWLHVDLETLTEKRGAWTIFIVYPMIVLGGLMFFIAIPTAAGELARGTMSPFPWDQFILEDRKHGLWNAALSVLAESVARSALACRGNFVLIVVFLLRIQRVGRPAICWSHLQFRGQVTHRFRHSRLVWITLLKQAFAPHNHHSCFALAHCFLSSVDDSPSAWRHDVEKENQMD